MKCLFAFPVVLVHEAINLSIIMQIKISNVLECDLFSAARETDPRGWKVVVCYLRLQTGFEGR